MIELQVPGGTIQAYQALPTGGHGPGVLLLHAWWGLNGFFQDLADKLAAEGYVVLAPDLNDSQVATTIDHAEALMKQRDNGQTEQMVKASYASLRGLDATHPGPLGVIGFSMGAAWALWLSAEQPDDVGAVALFYGSYPVDFAAARAAYLGHFADNDEWEPMDGIDMMATDMRAAGREVTMHTYPGAQHWFMEPDRPEYHPAFAEQAWQRTLAFLATHLHQHNNQTT